jgi:photosystem I subunit PsaN
MMATLNRPTRAVSCRAQAQQQAPMAPAASGRRALVFGFVALAAGAAKPAFAALEDELLAKSTVNKALNDKKRLATSYANLARTR